MLQFDVVTLFPPMFEAVTEAGITGRARDRGIFGLVAWNPRDFARNSYRTVDDRPYGGGPGMVMMAEPLRLCLQAIRADRGQSREHAPLLLFSPTGEVLQHDRVAQLSAGDGAVLLCGRYEGIDQRFIDRYVDGQISLGDWPARSPLPQG